MGARGFRAVGEETTGATTGGNVTREPLPLFPRNGRCQRSRSLTAEASEKVIEYAVKLSVNDDFERRLTALEEVSKQRGFRN